MNKKKRILIYLPNYQDNHLSYYLVLINRVFKKFDTTLLVYTENSISFESVNLQNIVCSNQRENPLAYIWRNRKIFLNADLIVWDEIYKRSIPQFLCILLFGKKSLLTIHNVNKWLNRHNGENRSITSFLIYVIIRRIKGLIVISPSLKEYIRNNNLFQKELYYIPFCDFNISKGYHRMQASTDKINIVIPGTVNNTRRNYFSIIKSIYTYLLNDSNNKEIRLVLLGEIIKIGKKELDLIRKINSTKPDTIKLWENYIEQNEFDQEMSKADFLIANVNVNYTENKVIEIYGKTKESGILFLMLQYNVPTFFPSTYQVHEKFKHLVIKYENNPKFIEENLVDIIVERKFKNDSFKSLDMDSIQSKNDIRNLIKNI